MKSLAAGLSPKELDKIEGDVTRRIRIKREAAKIKRSAIPKCRSNRTTGRGHSCSCSGCTFDHFDSHIFEAGNWRASPMRRNIIHLLADEINPMARPRGIRRPRILDINGACIITGHLAHAYNVWGWLVSSSAHLPLACCITSMV